MKIIYKVTNKATGSAYIGATTKSLECRKEDHIQRAYNNPEKPLHKAILTYGVDAFIWESIDTAITNNELAEKEVNYIYEFGKKSELYNLSRGGEIQKEVYKYDVESLKLIEHFNSLTEASASIGYTKQALSKVCLSVNQKLGSYYWSYKKAKYFIPNSDNRKKQVYQFTIDGKFLNTFNSIADANRQTKINKTSIAKVCRGERKTAGGYFWCFK